MFELLVCGVAVVLAIQAYQQDKLISKMRKTQLEMSGDHLEMAKLVYEQALSNKAFREAFLAQNEVNKRLITLFSRKEG